MIETDDLIVVPIPKDLAAHFAADEAYELPSKREIFRLQLGTADLGFWRISQIVSQNDSTVPRVVATLRRVLP